MTRFMERFQIPLYLAALAVGALAGWWAPGLGGLAAPAVTPVLAALLYVTFLGIPLRRVGEGLRDLRFMACLVIVNFAVVPVIVFALVRAFSIEGPMLIGVLLVLLTPCIDYVIVFSGLAGAANDRLLAASPVLLVLQMLTLPLYLWSFLAPDVAMAVHWGTFAQALAVVIVIPLVAAAVTQWAAARSPVARRWGRLAGGAMVPLMMLTLATVVASQIALVGSRAQALLPLVPVYVSFAALMTALGWAAGRLAGLRVRERRAVLFSGVTRNSLVVLPLALAAPDGTVLAPLAVLTQTLVELLVMLALVGLVPRLVR
ncbi:MULTISPECIES: arsenic resistance protein [Kocuria]|uniref:Arsenite efflux pump ArsB, ACR3 family n=2 Tax=Kocuria TaxID=57493 RepID=A0A1X7EB47_9MICC|nr:arsenic resistance protein [Kocuria indica]OXS78917.1 arsenic resistance protein [Kocuria indica]RLP56713.1 arsenic resistance protein [Kocuria indica]SMF30854.1 Arsenite efflux pump ArsB, ACR3 family [Kocuria indica]